MHKWLTHPKAETMSYLFERIYRPRCTQLSLLQFYSWMKMLSSSNCSQQSKALLFFLAVYNVFMILACLCLTHVCGHLTFTGDKLERVAEYSKTGDSVFWAVIYKLVAQPAATLATKNLRASDIITSTSCVICVKDAAAVKQSVTPLAVRTSVVPCRQWESPSSWWHCPLWWFQWKPAKETSGQTWSGWRTAGGYIGSTHTYLRGTVTFRSHCFVSFSTWQRHLFKMM